MGLTVRWTRFAEKKLEDIYQYYRLKASPNVAKKLASKIVQSSLKLRDHPNVGTIEPLLADRPQSFRYIIHNYYKIIYWVNESDNFIEIVNVFDCRRNPDMIQKELS